MGVDDASTARTAIERERGRGVEDDVRDGGVAASETSRDEIFCEWFVVCLIFGVARPHRRRHRALRRDERRGVGGAANIRRGHRRARGGVRSESSFSKAEFVEEDTFSFLFVNEKRSSI